MILTGVAYERMKVAKVLMFSFLQLEGMENCPDKVVLQQGPNVNKAENSADIWKNEQQISRQECSLAYQGATWADMNE